ncbi:hypothetical protein BJ165DRAFT_1524777 [Panaeolus papilionaceus]|nr:hypothetical protein BJ165DRAFT_1524777 [Panaeolus papilionaceus]
MLVTQLIQKPEALMLKFVENVAMLPTHMSDNALETYLLNMKGLTAQLSRELSSKNNAQRDQTKANSVRKNKAQGSLDIRLTYRQRHGLWEAQGARGPQGGVGHLTVEKLNQQGLIKGAALNDVTVVDNLEIEIEYVDGEKEEDQPAREPSSTDHDEHANNRHDFVFHPSSPTQSTTSHCPYLPQLPLPPESVPHIENITQVAPTATEPDDEIQKADNMTTNSTNARGETMRTRSKDMRRREDEEPLKEPRESPNRANRQRRAMSTETSNTVAGASQATFADELVGPRRPIPIRKETAPPIKDPAPPVRRTRKKAGSRSKGPKSTR